MAKVYRITALMLLIILVIGILNVVLATLSMGGNANPAQVRFNQNLNYFIGFPVVIFNKSFPLLLSQTDFWSLKTMVLLLVNTFIQACGLYYFGKWLNRRL